MTEIFEPKHDRNCGKCTWSTRDSADLHIDCMLGKKIENTWVTAHNCNYYTTQPIKKRKITKKKHNQNIQLDLFKDQNL